MTLLSEQTTRIQNLLQDNRTDVTTLNNVATAHQESLQSLARQGAFSSITWLNAFENQGLYTLPADIVTVYHVLYNQKSLRYVKEKTLQRLIGPWELLRSEPTYWTMDNQLPNVIRIIPAPTRTGSEIPIFPSPIGQDMADNLVIFATEDPSVGLTDAEDVLPTLLDWDDWLVWRTTKDLAFRENPEQNIPVSELCNQLESLWAKFLRF